MGNKVAKIMFIIIESCQSDFSLSTLHPGASATFDNVA